MSQTSQTLFQKIHKLQVAVRSMQKDGKSYGYEYLTGDKLFSAIRPKMDELGLLLLPSVTSTSMQTVKYQAYDSKSKAMFEKTENLVSIDIDMTWVDVDTGETYTQKWHGTGQNGYDKGYGSALTYAERYFFMKTFHIATDADDVDAIARVRDEAIEKAAAGTAANFVPPVSQKAAPVYPSVDSMNQDEAFWKWVEAAASGRKTKDGIPARDAWIRKFRPTGEQLHFFDGTVADKRAIMNQMK